MKVAWIVFLITEIGYFYRTHGDRFILLIGETDQEDVIEILESSLSVIPDLKAMRLLIDWKADNESSAFCKFLPSHKISGIVDITYGLKSLDLYLLASANRIPYAKADMSNYQLLLPVMNYIETRKGTSALFLTNNPNILRESFHNFMVQSKFKVVVSNVLNKQELNKLQLIRPTPMFIIAYGSAKSIVSIYNTIKKIQLVKGCERWIFVVTDKSQHEILGRIVPFSGSITFIIPDLTKFPIQREEDFRGTLVSSFGEYLKGSFPSLLPSVIGSCTQLTEKKKPLNLFSNQKSDTFIYLNDSITFLLDSQIIIKSLTSSEVFGGMEDNLWKNKIKMKPLKRYFKIGVIIIRPWLFYESDESGNRIKDPVTGEEKLTGYIIELIQKLSRLMDFEYDLIISSHYGSYLESNDSWNGIVGLLIDGKVDMAIADLTATLERHEVVEFVSPYFFQTGLAILFRKPVKEDSFLKFMDVLQQEVWLAILGALVLTGVLLWFLEKCSPLSGQHDHTEERCFGIMECLWFATSSFTPLGGGESPKSISGRILVSVYWLFAGIILATFSANLAALLTVERLKTSINDLDDLAMESMFNYTVVENSPVHGYFKSLAKAEKDIYQIWKDTSLKKKMNRYGKLWNYPVKEKFNRILKSIEHVGFVKNEREGYDRVLKEESGLFAFITDVTNLRHEFYSNCNYSYMSKIFAEQSLSMAVRHGSPLSQELSRATLLLQKNYFLDYLSHKYWNASHRTKCETDVDSEGITPRSLVGAFLCALAGILLSLLTLIYEVLQRKFRKRTSKISNKA